MYKLKWLIFAILSAILSGSVSAWGGLYSKQGDEDFSINSVTLTYGVDSANGIITADIVESYRGRSENFLWILPVPDDPSLEVETVFKPLKVPNTPILLDLPPNYCANLYEPVYVEEAGVYYDGGEGYPQVKSFKILESAELLSVLQAGEYNVPQATIDSIKTYNQADIKFALLQMQQQKSGEFGQVSVRFKYHSDKIFLPLTLLAGYELHINILADTRYAPENYKEAKVDLTNLRIGHSISRGQAALQYFSDRSNYLVLRDSALKAFGSQSFITELAASSKQLLSEMNDNTREEGLYIRTDMQDTEKVIETLKTYPYLTRFYSWGNTISPDTKFIPSPQLPDVSNILDTSSAEPLMLWGCTSRAIPDSRYKKLTPDLPIDYKILDSGASWPVKQLVVPQSWQLYKITYNSREISIIASEPVDETTLSTYLAGGSTPPMLLVHSIGEGNPNGCNPYDLLDTPPNSNLPPYFRCTTDLSQGVNYYSSMVGILTSQADFAANEAMYKAMVDFPFTNQYMLHPELRNTLMLKPSYDAHSDFKSYFPSLVIGYPEGWSERVIDKQDLLIMPETFKDMTSAPYVYIYLAEKVATPSIMSLKVKFAENKNNVADWLVEHFGVEKEAFIADYLGSCGLSTPLTYFSYNGRIGYVSYVIDQYLVDQPFVLEISAPDELYPKYKHDIENIRDSVVTLFGCG